jgi:hypothetical protein
MDSTTKEQENHNSTGKRRIAATVHGTQNKDPLAQDALSLNCRIASKDLSRLHTADDNLNQTRHSYDTTIENFLAFPRRSPISVNHPYIPLSIYHIYPKLNPDILYPNKPTRHVPLIPPLRPPQQPPQQRPGPLHRTRPRTR